MGDRRVEVAIVATTDDQLLAEHYRSHWLAQGVAAAEAAPDWRERFLAFVVAARAERALAAFLAQAGGQPLGSACCQLVERVYPAFLAIDGAPLGYIWGVYVEPAARGRGVGGRLVEACVAHLRRQGVGRVLLHTGAQARPLYERLGFAATDELALRLGAQSSRGE